jgi:hypothetical protein
VRSYLVALLTQPLPLVPRAPHMLFGIPLNCCYAECCVGLWNRPELFVRLFCISYVIVLLFKSWFLKDAFVFLGNVIWILLTVVLLRRSSRPSIVRSCRTPTLAPIRSIFGLRMWKPKWRQPSMKDIYICLLKNCFLQISLFRNAFLIPAPCLCLLTYWRIRLPLTIRKYINLCT